MHYGLLIMEFIRNATGRVKEKSYNINKDTINILKDSKGLIFMTAHMGNWEMIIPIISKYKKIMAVVRDQNNSGGNKFFYKARNYKNTTLIASSGSKKEMIKSLYDNSLLVLASDQNTLKRGVMINFFGKAASIPKGAGHFHYQTKSKVVICFCILNKELNYDFHLEYLNIEKYNIEQKDELIVKVCELYVRKLEKIIIQYPEQYFWFHKKWDKDIYDS